MKEKIIKGKELLDNLQELYHELDNTLKYQPKKNVSRISPGTEDSKLEDDQNTIQS